MGEMSSYTIDLRHTQGRGSFTWNSTAMRSPRTVQQKVIDEAKEAV